MELADEDELVPYDTLSCLVLLTKLIYHPRYKIGDSFVHLPLDEAQSMLSASSEDIDAEVSRLEESLGELREELTQLKAALYARFGKAINLDV